MKVTTQDLEAIRTAVAPLDTADIRARYAAKDFPRADAVKDLNKRYRWDLFYAARAYNGLEGEYLDAHLDTALRSIIAPL